jgi:hypothetical protein
MKVAHKNQENHTTKAGMLEEAKEFEAAGELKKAESLYRKVIKAGPHNELPYNRLMIIYRKQKEPGKELAIVKKAISAFEDMYAPSIRQVKSKKVSTLSNAFLQATGLTDKKGKLLHLPEPWARWNRRKALVEKKLKKS